MRDTTVARAYSTLAHVYDAWMTHIDYGAITVRCASLLADALRPRVLDLCAGTATVPIRLASAGAEVVAVDRSPEMLAIAGQKISAAGVAEAVELYELDVLDDAWPEGRFQLVVCTGDSASYFTRTQLDELLGRVYDALEPQGWFLFDLNSEHKLCDVFGNTTYVEDRDGFAYIWVNRLADDGDHIDFDITIVSRDSKGVTRRRGVEHHRQYVHDLEGTLSALRHHGFAAWQATADFEGDNPIAVDSLRWVFAVQR